MPRKPRNSPNPPGRPRKIPPAIAAQLAAGTMAPEDAAAKVGAARSTAYAAKARHGAAKAPSKPQAGPAAKAAPSGASDRRPALLAALSSALEASPALAESLPLDPVELGRRLAGSALVNDGDLDPLAILRRVQGRLEQDMATLAPDAVAARKGVAQALVQLAKGAEAIMADRPPVGETPEQIVARLLAERRKDALAKVFEHVEAEEAKAA
jgi:hypothetical protein